MDFCNYLASYCKIMKVKQKKKVII